MKYKLLFTLALALLLIPVGVFAAEFRALVGIPGIENIAADGGLNQYINALYRLSISIAALLAVIKIVIAGAKYMLTDIVPAKEEAKKDIQGALIGLLIVIGAIIILNTINTDLANVNFNLEGVEFDDAPVLTGRDQRDAECPPDECTYYPCSETLRALSGLPAGSSCRQMCDSINGFFYQTQTGARECAATATDLEATGNSQIVRMPCRDLRNGPSVNDFQCRDARAACTRSGGITVGDDNDVPSISCAVPNSNGTSSVPGTTATSSASLPSSEEAAALEGARDRLCVEGYDCEVIECEAWTNFGCNSWCQTESGFTGDYDRASGMCYANTRDSAEVIAVEAAAAAEALRQQEAACRATAGRIWVNGACQDEYIPPISP